MRSRNKLCCIWALCWISYVVFYISLVNSHCRRLCNPQSNISEHILIVCCFLQLSVNNSLAHYEDDLYLQLSLLIGSITFAALTSHNFNFVNFWLEWFIGDYNFHSNWLSVLLVITISILSAKMFKSSGVLAVRRRWIIKRLTYAVKTYPFISGSWCHPIFRSLISWCAEVWS